MMINKNELEKAATKFAREGSWCCPVSFWEGAKWQSEQCAQIAEQEKIAFSIEVLNGIVKSATQNGFSITTNLSIKLKELKSIQDEK